MDELLPDQKINESAHQITERLIAWGSGDVAALDDVIHAVYQELRRMADRYLRQERPGHTLQPTALVHEAYLRLVDQTHVSWKNRAHFFGVAAQTMRRILVDHARAKHRDKRGGTQMKLSLDEALDLSQGRASDLVALDDALRGLAEIDQRKSRVVELRFFGGLRSTRLPKWWRCRPKPCCAIGSLRRHGSTRRSKTRRSMMSRRWNYDA